MLKLPRVTLVTQTILQTKFCALVTLMLCGLFSLSVSARVPDFADLVSRNSPAVVKIFTEQTMTANPMEGMDGEQVPEIFRELFEQYGGPRQNPNGMGSGFVISDDGYVVTNHHVIAGADKVKVSLIDRREFAAAVVGTDPTSDLALLKISATDLPTVSFAEADSIRVGEWVIAIGSPFGLDYSASVGIVSAIGRSLPNSQGENYVPFLQSDVAINPGNSGGPLFNQDGNVVGINSQIYTRSGGSVGISFAIPVGVAIDVIAQLKDNGAVERGWLGVYIQDVSPELAKSLGLDRPAGALVAQVVPDSPAARSDLRPGDVIIKFGSADIGGSGDLPQIVGMVSPGSKVNAKVVRDGMEMPLMVEVGVLPQSGATAENDPRVSRSGDILGLSVNPVDAETASTFNLSGGVVVDKVYPNSPASYTRLLAGDVIVQLGDVEVIDAESYEAALEKLPKGTPVLIRFLRQGSFVYRTIELAP